MSPVWNCKCGYTNNTRGACKACMRCALHEDGTEWMWIVNGWTRGQWSAPKPPVPRKMVAGDIGLGAWESANVYRDAWPSPLSDALVIVAWLSAHDRAPREYPV